MRTEILRVFAAGMALGLAVASVAMVTGRRANPPCVHVDVTIDGRPIDDDEGDDVIDVDAPILP